MLIEYFFLYSILSGHFTPSSEQGWERVERHEVSSPSLAVCLAERDRTYRYYHDFPIPGGAVVITDCQERRR